jgi:5-methylcytosine-specific restriction endonuclease McrA
VALTRPCIGCGEPIPSGSRCRDCKPKRTTTATRNERHRPAAWDRLSKRLRKDSPFCELCGATTDLVVDHIISVSEDPTLALEPLNCRVLCRSENARRKNTCTDDERAAVHAAIAARKARLARFYASTHNGA